MHAIGAGARPIRPIPRYTRSPQVGDHGSWTDGSPGRSTHL